MRRFHINFDGPEHGWLDIRLQTPDGEIAVSASHVLYDTFTELIQAVGVLDETGSCRDVRVFEEPAESILRLTRDHDSLIIDHLPATKRHCVKATRLVAPYRTAMREIARKAKHLLEDVGYDAWVANWHYRPPKEALERAWRRYA